MRNSELKYLGSSSRKFWKYFLQWLHIPRSYDILFKSQGETAWFLEFGLDCPRVHDSFI